MLLTLLSILQEAWEVVQTAFFWEEVLLSGLFSPGCQRPRCYFCLGGQRFRNASDLAWGGQHLQERWACRNPPIYLYLKSTGLYVVIMPSCWSGSLKLDGWLSHPTTRSSLAWIICTQLLLHHHIYISSIEGDPAFPGFIFFPSVLFLVTLNHTAKQIHFRERRYLQLLISARFGNIAVYLLFFDSDVVVRMEWLANISKIPSSRQLVSQRWHVFCWSMVR